MDEAEAIKYLCVDALLTDGAHHKQWYLEEILKVLGVDLAALCVELDAKGYSWDEAIAP